MDKVKKFFSANIREISLVIVMIALSVFIQWRSGGNFLTMENISDMLAETAVLAICAVGMMLVIVTGGIDLSIGACGEAQDTAYYRNARYDEYFQRNDISCSKRQLGKAGGNGQGLSFTRNGQCSRHKQSYTYSNSRIYRRCILYDKDAYGPQGIRGW